MFIINRSFMLFVTCGGSKNIVSWRSIKDYIYCMLPKCYTGQILIVPYAWERF